MAPMTASGLDPTEVACLEALGEDTLSAKNPQRNHFQTPSLFPVDDNNADDIVQTQSGYARIYIYIYNILLKKAYHNASKQNDNNEQ